MVGFNIEILNSGANPPLYFVHKFDGVIATFKYLLKMAVLNKHLNKAEVEKVG